jgi:hypothetical protein
MFSNEEQGSLRWAGPAQLSITRNECRRLRQPPNPEGWRFTKRPTIKRLQWQTSPSLLWFGFEELSPPEDGLLVCASS